MMPDRPVACYIVRHGVTSLNQSNSFRGNANPPLVPQGIKEAQRLAQMFEDIDISHIFCSPKQRSVKTAEIIAGAKGVPVHQSEALSALNVGEFSGQKRTPETESALQRYLDAPQITIPGGESLAAFQARIRPCLNEALQLYQQCGAPPMLVAHSSVVHEVGALTKGSHKSVLVEPGGVVAVYYNPATQKLDAEPVYKPLKSPRSQAETIT